MWASELAGFIPASRSLDSGRTIRRHIEPELDIGASSDQEKHTRPPHEDPSLTRWNRVVVLCAWPTTGRGPAKYTAGAKVYVRH